MGKELLDGTTYVALFHCPFSSQWLSYIKSTSHLSLFVARHFGPMMEIILLNHLLSIDEQEDEEAQNKPHIIYRHSTRHREPATARHACDTSGICVLLSGDPGCELGCQASKGSYFTGYRELPFTVSLLFSLQAR